MYGVSEELKEKVNELNMILNEKYRKLLDMNNDDLRDFIQQNIGEIVKVEKLSTEELDSFYNRGGIIGVDGSKNRLGGAYPHYVEIYQGLAKSSISSNEPVYIADFFTPLNTEEEDEIIKRNGKDTLDTSGNEEFIRNYKLSGIEVDVALESVKKYNPYAIMMDGSLIRYDIECFEKWVELRKECEKRGVILIGVIKDIKTSMVGTMLLEEGVLRDADYLYDREMLYGLLGYGEMIKIREDVAKKSKEGFASVFMRSSNTPNVIGMDIIDSQREYLDEMARLVFTLTPVNSRGVPLWLDIVDKEVKLSDKMMRSLLENYLDRDILEKFFISERDKRTL
ncbi:DNA double-strand break repair nuclease NurA [Anaerosalibacter sp. Marseille-P3206]|uniref:DNA double-strand break repair nuclease NurA n=1 Tax=Anaerosalibacter sp. Marseille-P3206 TaxID=1871005 RepID=UPI0009866F4E|nr:DNA double-strand break repair nuclease NurA [Anaerosalibacter sp. Marseille-P3206]